MGVKKRDNFLGRPNRDAAGAASGVAAGETGEKTWRVMVARVRTRAWATAASAQWPEPSLPRPQCQSAPRCSTVRALRATVRSNGRRVLQPKFAVTGGGAGQAWRICAAGAQRPECKSRTGRPCRRQHQPEQVRVPHGVSAGSPRRATPASRIGPWGSAWLSACCRARFPRSNCWPTQCILVRLSRVCVAQEPNGGGRFRDLR